MINSKQLFSHKWLTDLHVSWKRDVKEAKAETHVWTIWNRLLSFLQQSHLHVVLEPAVPDQRLLCTGC